MLLVVLWLSPIHGGCRQTPTAPFDVIVTVSGLPRLQIAFASSKASDAEVSGLPGGGIIVSYTVREIGLAIDVRVEQRLAKGNVEIRGTITTDAPVRFVVRGMTSPMMKIDGVVYESTRPVPRGWHTVHIHGILDTPSSVPATQPDQVGSETGDILGTGSRDGGQSWFLRFRSMKRCSGRLQAKRVEVLHNTAVAR